MSDANLLVFGCMVTFIGIAGAYVYIRECFASAEERPPETDAQSAETVRVEVSEAA